MPRYEGINRNYSTSAEGNKTPEEKQKDLDKKIKEFLAKGGKIQKVEPKITKQMLQNWKI